MSKKIYQRWSIPLSGSYIIHIEKDKGYTIDDWKEIEQLFWDEHANSTDIGDVIDSDGAELLEEYEEDE